MSSTSDKKAIKRGFSLRIWQGIEVFYEKHYKKMALIPTNFG
jgi:hypothetical protein